MLHDYKRITIHIISDIMVTRSKNKLRKIWKICPTVIRLPAAPHYYCRTYWENIVNNFRLKSSIFFKRTVYCFQEGTHTFDHQKNHPPQIACFNQLSSNNQKSRHGAFHWRDLLPFQVNGHQC